MFLATKFYPNFLVFDPRLNRGLSKVKNKNREKNLQNLKDSSFSLGPKNLKFRQKFVAFFVWKERSGLIVDFEFFSTPSKMFFNETILKALQATRQLLLSKNLNPNKRTRKVRTEEQLTDKKQAYFSSLRHHMIPADGANLQQIQTQETHSVTKPNCVAKRILLDVIDGCIKNGRFQFSDLWNSLSLALRQPDLSSSQFSHLIYLSLVFLVMGIFLPVRFPIKSNEQSCANLLIRSTTLAKKNPYSWDIHKLIYSSIMLHHETSTSICNTSLRCADTSGRISVKPLSKSCGITWSNCRSTSWIFGLQRVFFFF